MTIGEIKMLGRDCYAAFNQTPPADSGRAWILWAEMCKNVPLAAAGWIREKIIDQEAMPRNFGKTVRSLAQEWLLSNGKHIQATCCPDCDTATPGFFTAWRWLPGNRLDRFMCACACNTARGFGDMERLTRSQAKSRGWTVMHGVYNNAFIFEHEVILGLPPVDAGEWLKGIRNRDFRQRIAHLEQIEELT